jgi:hypothetical protein
MRVFRCAGRCWSPPKAGLKTRLYRVKDPPLPVRRLASTEFLFVAADFQTHREPQVQA